MSQPSSLSQALIDFFAANGYVALGQLLEDDELALLREQYDAEFERAEADHSVRNLAGSEPAAGGGAVAAPRKRMLQLMQMCERNIHFRRLLYDARILDRVQDLIGPNIMLFHDQALFKPARDGGLVTWHQDNAYWKCRPANLVSCWLTLDDVTRDNGAMQVIPGSHLQPVWHGQAQSTDALLEIEGADATQAVAVDLPAGGAMLHHCQTLHYTQPNETDRQRRALAIHFMAPGTRRENGEVIGVSFAHPMLRMSI